MKVPGTLIHVIFYWLCGAFAVLIAPARAQDASIVSTETDGGDPFQAIVFT